MYEYLLTLGTEIQGVTWWDLRGNERGCDVPRSAKCSRWTVHDGVHTRQVTPAVYINLLSFHQLTWI